MQDIRPRTLARLGVVLATLVTIAHSQAYKVVYDLHFDYGGVSAPTQQGRDGNLYGTVSQGGSPNQDFFFKITPTGTLTVLHTFSGAASDSFPTALSLGTDGNFYGGTQCPCGIQLRSGTLFKITPTGELTTLHVFNSGPPTLDGWAPYVPPIEGMDGNFYGTTFLGGGNADNGTVYTISSSGTYRKLHAFHPSDAHPLHSLTLGIDGKFYGSTAVGTIFRITSSGDFTDLSHTVGLFDSGLIQGRDGNFYGTAPNDGPANAGTVFKMTPAGQITVLHNFTGSEDGEAPYGGVVQATDGNFYGTTYGPGCGTIFRISSAGSFATLYTLPNDGSMGCSPYSGLLQHTNGLLYGLTISGGTNGNTRGVFFSFDVGLAPFVSFLPAASRVGQTVGIFGQGFTGTTAVSFNNIPAQFTVVSDTYLTAPVPSGATTGFVTVTTPGGTLTGNKKFQVRPQVLSFSPASGAVGTTVVITGVSLGGATQVTFDGVETPFSQNSDTQVTARVPSGAATGHVGVTTTGAASYGHTVFTVTP